MNENLIDRYLLNLLTPEEKQAFEEQLEKDESLKEELLYQQELIKSVEGIGRIELKSKLQEIHKKVNLDSKQPNSNIRKLFFRFASAAIFIGVLSLGWWFIQQTPTNSNLYTQNFEPFELSLIQRSEVDQGFSKIESLYDEGNYSQVIPLFEKVLNESEVQSSQILLGLGISYLQTDRPKAAIAQFKNILANKDFNFEDEAQWYLGLSYLKMEDIKTAKSHLNILATDPQRDHHKDAKKLVSQIN